MDQYSLLDDLSDDQLEKLLNQRRAAKEAQQQKKREDYEKLKDETINKFGYLAIELQQKMIEFKTQAFNDMEAIYELLQDYSKRHREGKGNFRIENEHYRISYRTRVIMDFDERATQAKQHIRDFVDSQWDGDDATRELILNLLNSKNGQLDVRDIQKLYKMENRFDNENWREGLRLLKESYLEKDTKGYIQFEKKMKDGSFEPIVLNFAALDVDFN